MRVKVSNYVDKFLYNNKCFAYIIKKHSFEEKYNFVTDQSEPFQLGFFNMNKGDVSKRHYHIKNKRVSKKTSEFIYVIKGSLLIKFYNTRNKLLNYSKVNEGGCILIFDQAHEITYGSKTKILEVKTGPFSINEKKFI